MLWAERERLYAETGGSKDPPLHIIDRAMPCSKQAGLKTRRYASKTRLYLIAAITRLANSPSLPACQRHTTTRS